MDFQEGYTPDRPDLIDDYAYQNMILSQAQFDLAQIHRDFGLACEDRAARNFRSCAACSQWFANVNPESDLGGAVLNWAKTLEMGSHQSTELLRLAKEKLRMGFVLKMFVARSLDKIVKEQSDNV